MTTIYTPTAEHWNARDPVTVLEVAGWARVHPKTALATVTPVCN